MFNLCSFMQGYALHVQYRYIIISNILLGDFLLFGFHVISKYFLGLYPYLNGGGCRKKLKGEV